MQKIHIKSLDDLDRAAKDFVSFMGHGRVFAFRGSMGAGKTTFIKAICSELGVLEGQVTSPTFAIVNEYETIFDTTLYHFDCYRLKDIREAYDIGAEEYFNSGKTCFVEWPEIIEALLPEGSVLVQIEVNDDDSRTVLLSRFAL